nr:leucine-rich repeat protein [uncultured Acetobacterium sp.]
MLALVMATGVLTPMTPPVQAVDDVYGVLANDGLIYASDADNPTTPGAVITDEQTVTHLFAADTVTTVAMNRFAEYSNLIAVNMPEVTEINGSAFSKCSKLTTVNIPKALTIGEDAFSDCDALIAVAFPAATTIGDSAFDACDELRTVDFPNVSTIGKDVFNNCMWLSTINFPEAITIDTAAFNNCRMLTNANFPKVTTIGTFSFNDCMALEVANFPKASTIGEHAFYYCSKLNTIDFSVAKTIDQYAFQECDALTTVKFPLVETIGLNALRHCNALTTVEFSEATTIGVSSFYDCIELKTAKFPKATEIDGSAFENCSKLSDLTLGAEPPTVLEYAFLGVDATKTLTLTGGNTTAAVAAYKAVNDGDIGDDAWYGWPLAVTHYLVTVNGGTGSAIYRVGDHVTITAAAPEPGKYFVGWTVQTGGMILVDPAKQSSTFIMPAEDVQVTANYADFFTTNISFDANGGAGSMSPQQINTGSPKALTANAFTRTDYYFNGWNTEKNGGGTAYKDRAEFTATKNETVTLYAQWKQNVYGVLKSDGMIYETNADNKAPTNIEIDDKNTVTHLFAADEVTTISDNAFDYWPNLIEVDMPKVTTISSYAFYNCDGLTSVKFPVATEIGTDTFYDCKGLTSVEFPAVTTIGEDAFKKCTTLTSVKFPAATQISYAAFYDCDALKTLQFPAATTIDDYAFYDCDALTSVEFPVVTTIDFHAFYHCDKLTMVQLPVATTIGEFAFECCYVLTTAQIPSANTIGEDAFKWNEIFSNLTLGADPPTVGNNAFADIAATANRTLTLAGGNTTSAVAAYKAVNDGNSTDDTWYGWPLVVTHYPVTVNGGIKSANYRIGEQVTIAAAAPASGQRFKTWRVESGDMTLAEPTNPSTTFIMPEKAVEVTANYELAPEPSQTYTLTYNANGGTGTMKEQVFNSGTKQSLVKNTFERTGYGFSSWNTKPDGTGTAYPDGADFTATANTTLYAQWTEGRFKVSGKVVDNSNNPVPDVSMELKQGNRQIGQTVKTDAAGNFTINAVPNGNYDLVVSKSGGVVTILVHVDNIDLIFANAIILPTGKLNSVVEVKVNTPAIVVGNLDKQFDRTDEEIAAKGGLVEIKFVAEKQDETVPGAAEIMMTAASTPQTVGLFIDLSILKTIGMSTQSIDALPSLIDVLIPLDDSLQGKKDYFIYRYHGAAVDVITTTANEQGEKIELIDDGSTLKMSVKQFSTYAIAYDEAIADGISYRTHVQNMGWETSWETDGNPAGTEGQSLRLEGIQIKLIGDELPAGAKIEYRTHIQNQGWETAWSSDGNTAGTEGQSLRLEGIQIRLIDMPGYSVEYRTHVQNKGWETTWASDGESARTEGQGLRLEAIEIRLDKN